MRVAGFETERRIEAEARRVVGPDFEPDQTDPCRARAGLEPQHQRPAEPAPALLRMNAEQRQVRRLVRVIHDAERQKRAALADDGNVGRTARDRVQDARLGPTPAQAMLDVFARQLSNAARIARQGQPHFRNDDHVARAR